MFALGFEKTTQAEECLKPPQDGMPVAINDGTAFFHLCSSTTDTQVMQG
jgi:hypothetical protein